MMETEIEPLEIAPELRADSLVALVHNAMQRDPDKEALRWKLPKTKRQTGGPPVWRFVFGSFQRRASFSGLRSIELWTRATRLSARNSGAISRGSTSVCIIGRTCACPRSAAAR